MIYDCRDVAIILRQLKFRKTQSTHTFHNERKKVFKPMFVLESKRKDKSNPEVLGLWQRSLRLHDVIDFWRNWPFISYDSGILIFFVANRYSSNSCIKDKSIASCADVTRLLLMFENLRLTLAKKRCEWECNKTIISEKKHFCFSIC